MILSHSWEISLLNLLWWFVHNVYMFLLKQFIKPTMQLFIVDLKIANKWNKNIYLIISQILYPYVSQNWTTNKQTLWKTSDKIKIQRKIWTVLSLFLILSRILQNEVVLFSNILQKNGLCFMPRKCLRNFRFVIEHFSHLQSILTFHRNGIKYLDFSGF